LARWSDANTNANTDTDGDTYTHAHAYPDSGPDIFGKRIRDKGTEW
jgi:hypothetical protein